jgi:hypothetical protein
MHWYIHSLLSDTSQGLGDDFAVPEGMVEVTLTEVVRSSKRVITGARDFRLNAQDDVRPLLFAVDIGAAVCFRLLLLLLLLSPLADHSALTTGWHALLHAGGGAVLPRLGRPAAAHHPL